jgi:hypothetical protein
MRHAGALWVQRRRPRRCRVLRAAPARREADHFDERSGRLGVPGARQTRPAAGDVAEARSRCARGRRQVGR